MVANSEAFIAKFAQMFWYEFERPPLGKYHPKNTKNEHGKLENYNV